VLITNISPLTSNQVLRRHFSTHGTIASFEPQIDKENGGALGILFIRYVTHEEAKRCVEKENGRNGNFGMAGGGPTGKADGEELRAVLDGEGATLKAVLKELEDRKKREREEKRRREKGISLGASSSAASAHGKTATPNPSVGTPGMEKTPRQLQQGQGSRPATGTAPLQSGQRHPLPPNPMATAAAVAAASATSASPVNTSSTSIPSNSNANIPQKPSTTVTTSLPSINGATLPNKPILAIKARPPPGLVRARLGVAKAAPMTTQSRYSSGGRDGSPSSTSMHGGGSSWVASRDKEKDGGRGMYRGSHRPVLDQWQLSPMVDRDRDREWDTYVPSPMDRNFSRSRSRSRSRSWSRSRSRSLSPRYGRGRERERQKMGLAEREKEHEGVVDELAKNGKEHLSMSLMGGSVREEDVRAFFEGFKVDKVRFL
jgi:RNA recognition motif. (a.k.a. RRM, RBD, or RNP domain)